MASRFALGLSLLLQVSGALAVGPSAPPVQELVVATVNNDHMLTLQRMTRHFEQQAPGWRVRWVTMDEDRLRQAVTRDAATQSAQFDVVTVGSYEAQAWGDKGWLRALTPSADYRLQDILPRVREALTQGGQLHALPFYGESTMTMVRTDLLQAAGLSLPAQPTWQQVAEAARQLHQPAQGVYGICLRGKPGWGQNMALISIMANTHGGQWFNMRWQPQLQSAAWQQALSLYADLLTRFGPPGAAANGYNENLALFAAGRCAIWVDATVAGNFLNQPDGSQVVGKVAYLQAPVASTPRGARWLWVWALAVPAQSRHPAMAQRFIEWATSVGYAQLVATERGWQAVPGGTRRSTYLQPGYRQANPHADVELTAMDAADQTRPTEPPSPYIGIQWVGIPEFQSIGTAVGQLASRLLPPHPLDVATVQARAQALTEGKMRRSGYLKD
ncbi:sugar ABC transporter substrate-binding protein [Aquabacterium sp. A3]|uniref:ABC transporter substrate-binding protein n=1 Tax=Aquabacterium sp. A3 TaxID=3132829 RepID=UPI0031199F2C